VAIGGSGSGLILHHRIIMHHASMLHSSPPARSAPASLMLMLMFMNSFCD
jgi:hypothetical protein